MNRCSVLLLRFRTLTSADLTYNGGSGVTGSSLAKHAGVILQHSLTTN